MDWFEKLTGFREESPQQVRDNLVVEDGKMRLRSSSKTSRINNKTLVAGRLETPSLGEVQQ